jgi:hypothetical protein
MDVLLFKLLFQTCPESCFCIQISRKQNTKQKTTLSDGYLGSRNDEERSEMRYVMRIAELSESSNL